MMKWWGQCIKLSNPGLAPFFLTSPHRRKVALARTIGLLPAPVSGSAISHLVKLPVAVEKPSFKDSAKTALRQDAPQTILSTWVDIFYT